MRKFYPTILLYLTITLLSLPVFAGGTTTVISGSNKTISGNTYSGYNVTVFKNTGSYTTFDSITLTSNNFGTNGWGINNYAGTVRSIINSTFVENHANYGSSINNYVGTINLISDSNFEKNSAKSNGGAIYSTGKLNEISSSRFISNEAFGDTSKGAGYGGAIYAKQDLKITNSIFNDNSAYRKGGAIAQMNGDLTIVAEGNGQTAGLTSFTNNKQDYFTEGNDIYMGGSNQNLYVIAKGENDKVIIGSGIDFNKGLNIYVNKPESNAETALGSVVLGGNVGTSKNRPNIFLNGGTLSFVHNEIFNQVYANKVTINSDTYLGFDVDLTTGMVGYDSFFVNSVTGSGKFLITADSFNILAGLTEESDSAVLSLINSSNTNFKSFVNMIDKEGNLSNIIYIYGEDGVTKLYKVKFASDGTFIFSNPEYIDPITNPLAYAVNCEWEDPYNLVLSKNITVDSWEDIDPGVPRNKLIVNTLIITGKNKTITADNNLVGMDVDNSIAPDGVVKVLNVGETTFIGFDKAITNNGGDVTLTSVSFKNNISETGNGAALANIDGNMYITGTSKKRGVFYNNEAVNGGAIYNSANMQIDYANFGTNPTKKADYSNKAVLGGAIFNSQYDTENGTNLTISNSNFVDNEAVKGGAIYNEYKDGATANAVKIENATFTQNIATEMGGAIYNEGNLDVITSTFGNKSKKATYANTAGIAGAAVANAGEGKFVSSSSNYYYSNGENGGAIYNTDTAKADIKGGTFANNTGTNGGAIYNDTNATLTLDAYRYLDKKGNSKYTNLTFTANSALKGGAIYNTGSIIFDNFDDVNLPRNLSGVYSKNKATFEDQTREVNRSQKEDMSVYNIPLGGAIYNEGELNLNQSSFTQNTANSKLVLSVNQYTEGSYLVTEQVTRFLGKGGAIYNDTSSELNILNTTFSKNSAGQAGGAIYNEQDNDLFITNSVFDGNSARTLVTTVYSKLAMNGTSTKAKKTTVKEYVGDGGAVYTNGNVGINTSDKYSELADGTTSFKSNSAVNGGAIYAGGVVNANLATFTSNKADKDGGAIFTQEDVNVKDVTFSKNTAGGNAGGVHGKNVTVENSFFSGNKAIGNGGAIYATGDVTVNAQNYSTEGAPVYIAEFTSNNGYDGGAIYAGGTALIKDATFTSNKAKNFGGGLYAGGDIRVVNSNFTKNSAVKGGAVYVEAGKTATFINTSFTNNSASQAGGAIYAAEGSTVNIIAYDRDIVISGNKAGGKSNAIFLADGAVLWLEAFSYTDIYGNKVDRVITVNDVISGEGQSKVYLRGEGHLQMNSKIVGVSFSDKEQIKEHTFTMDIVEAMIQSCSMDLSGGASLNMANNNVATMSLRNLSLADGTTTNVAIDMDLQGQTSDKITAETVEGTGTLNVSKVNLTSNSKTPVTINVSEGSEVKSITATTAESAEATYKIKQYVDENGMLRAIAYGQKAKPCTLASPIAAQLGGYLTQINSYDQAFMNMDMNMLKTQEERNANRSACCGTSLAYAPEYNNGINQNGKGLWTRPYATFERVNLNNGPKVSNIGYGNFFGGDADMKYMNNGWSRQFSAYIGYNGSVQDYNSQSIDQNGGTLGVTEVWYKNNFFTGLTMNVGANVAQAHTDLGRENIPMMMAGVASKTGYNFEFKNGKFILQPSLLVSYSFVHSFAHDNGLGNRVSSSPLHAIQVAPGVKFIFNLPKNWQPYLAMNMRWNIIDKTHFSVQDVTIPDMSIDPYVEYGLGLQRKWGERFTGYGQAMVRNGGRNGVMLSFGFKWAIGK